jgi:hypothetical protein
MLDDFFKKLPIKYVAAMNLKHEYEYVQFLEKKTFQFNKK